MIENDIIEYHGKRPLWKTIVASMLFTGALLCFYAAFFTNPNPGDVVDPSYRIMLLLFGFWAAAFGSYHATIYDYFVDLKNRKFKIVDRIGPFQWGKWKDLIDVKSLTISKITDAEFEVELMFHGRKKFLITSFSEGEEAMAFAKKCESLLEVKLKNHLK